MKSSDVPRAVVLLSGGLDSSVLLHYLRQRMQDDAELHAISFDYGQRHAVELACAQWQAQTAGARHRVIPLQFLGPLLASGTTLVADGAPVPDLADLPAESLAQPPTYVPHRNLLLLSMAAAYAEANDIADVYYGAQAQDHYGYWDCTPAFLAGVNAVLALNHGQAVQVHAPFISHSKAENIRLGAELGVDFSRTWTCYRGSTASPPRPCGTCPACVERQTAFESAGLADPLLSI